MLTRRSFTILTIAVAAAGLAVSGLAGWGLHASLDGPDRLFHAAWKERFEAPSQLARGVDVIALATAVETRPGRLAWSDNGEDSLPFEEVTFEVARGVKGIGAGETLVVERAGGVDHENHAVLLDTDGGPFAIGAPYLLFLKRQEDGPFYYQVNDQGRFQVVEGRLRALDREDAVGAILDGRGVDEAEALLRGYLSGPDRPRGRAQDAP